MSHARPLLNTKLSEEEFLRWYWLKDELIDFCRLSKLQTAGQKPVLTERIAAFLGSREIPHHSPTIRNGVMPREFSLNTTISFGWRCSPALGAFFKQQCGPGFRFNAAMRNFIHSQTGASLQQAVECYLQSMSIDSPRQAIIPQNQFNRHTREFYLANPRATPEQVRAAWFEKRANAEIQAVLPLHGEQLKEHGL